MLLQVYQRQMSKEGLQKVIQKEQTDLKNQVFVTFLSSYHILINMLAELRPRPRTLLLQGNFLSTEDLRDLFSLHENVRQVYFNYPLKFKKNNYVCCYLPLALFTNISLLYKSSVISGFHMTRKQTNEIITT